MNEEITACDENVCVMWSSVIYIAVVILLNNCANLWWTVIIILLFYSAIASLFILEVLEKTSSVFFLKYGTGTRNRTRYKYLVVPGTGSMYRPCVV